jgi:hypothetical protein
MNKLRGGVGGHPPALWGTLLRRGAPFFIAILGCYAGAEHRPRFARMRRQSSPLPRLRRGDTIPLRCLSNHMGGVNYFTYTLEKKVYCEEAMRPPCTTQLKLMPRSTAFRHALLNDTGVSYISYAYIHIGIERSREPVV